MWFIKILKQPCFLPYFANNWENKIDRGAFSPFRLIEYTVTKTTIDESECEPNFSRRWKSNSRFKFYFRRWTFNNMWPTSWRVIEMATWLKEAVNTIRLCAESTYSFSIRLTFILVSARFRNCIKAVCFVTYQD